MRKKVVSKKKVAKTCRHDERAVFCRDVCQACFRTARIEIESGRETDDSLVAKQFLAPKKAVGRKSESGLAKKLARASR